MNAMTAKIAGRKHHPAAYNLQSTLALVHERSNPVDSHAVAVYADGRQIGYLERGLAHLVAPFLDRNRPVFASPLEGKDGVISLFIPNRADRLGGNIVMVTSSDGLRSYAVDCRNGICTCPAGIYVVCRHKRSLGITRKPLAITALTAKAVTPQTVAVAPSTTP
jgi:hypothetical protein